VSTRRQDILDDLRTTIGGVAGMGDVEVNRTEDFGEGTTYPATNLRSGSFALDLEASSFGMDEWDFTVEADIITFGDPEELMGLVHAAVMADRRRGGLADNTTLIEAEPNYNLNPPTGANGLTMKYQVRYEVPAGTI
jgi:hypothetical protein